MRPYLAILRDSFREAFASRTLPFLLVFFTISLVALAPIGLQEDVPWRLTFEDVSDQTLWFAKLRQQAAEEGDNPGKRLLERLPDDLETRLGLRDKPATADATGPGGVLLLTTAINSDVLPDRTFYDEAAWDNVPLSEEVRDLIRRDPARLSDGDVKRLNRLLLSAAYSGSLKTLPKSRATITYLGFEIPWITEMVEHAVTETEMIRHIIRSIIYIVCIWIVGPIGLLVGVIVTADLMPRTFEPGAIDLLLSKPVSRTLVFLTKFLGACAFILISFSYLVAGLWLIFWLRLDVWAPQILATIPLFLFSFAVIYAVSAVTGLRWRSPIMSVMVTVLVWGAAFLLGITRDAMGEQRADERTRQITVAGDALIVSDFERTSHVWSDADRDWIEKTNIVPPLSAAAATNPLVRPKVIGPIYDPTHRRIVVAEAGSAGENILRFGSAASNWRTTEGAPLPPGTTELFVATDGRLLAAGQAGLFEFRGDPTIQKKEFKIFGVFDLVPDDVKNAFVRVDDGKGIWSDRVVVDLDAACTQAAVYDQGLLTLIQRNGAGRFETTATRQLFEKDKAPPVVLALADGYIVAATDDGDLLFLDTTALKTVATLAPIGKEVPRTIQASPDGRYVAVLFHSGDVWLDDLSTMATGELGMQGAPTGQGDLSAVAFDAKGRLLASDRLRRVSIYAMPDLKLQSRHAGSLPTSEKVLRYGLTPVSLLLPDTYGLRSVYQYLFTDLKSESTTADAADLESRRIHLELRRPLVHNTLFLVVVLGLASVYLARKDF